jgi:hypothetical protein
MFMRICEVLYAIRFTTDFVRVIRGRWRYTSASTHLSVTQRTGKGYGKEIWEVNGTIAYVTNEASVKFSTSVASS